MTTQTLKINTNIVNNSNFKKSFFNILLYVAGFLAICYVFILINMVWNIVSRKNLETQARELNTQVSTLELEYLSLSNKIDINLAYSLGFKETKKEFANRKNLGSVAIAKNEF
ncbi:MAG: hypothetical protein V4504_00565 [Patescibacteria group bacterium]